MEKIFHTNNSTKNAEVATLIAYEIDFEVNSTKDKERLFVNDHGQQYTRKTQHLSMHPLTTNNKAAKYMQQKLTELNKAQTENQQGCKRPEQHYQQM